LHERERRTDNTLKTALLIYRRNSHSCNSHVTPPRNSQLTRHTPAQLTLPRNSHSRNSHSRNSQLTRHTPAPLTQLTRHTSVQLTLATHTSFPRNSHSQLARHTSLMQQNTVTFPDAEASGRRGCAVTVRCRSGNSGSEGKGRRKGEQRRRRWAPRWRNRCSSPRSPSWHL
jgi:hypothetical protein